MNNNNDNNDNTDIDDYITDFTDKTIKEVRTFSNKHKLAFVNEVINTIFADVINHQVDQIVEGINKEINQK